MGWRDKNRLSSRGLGSPRVLFWAYLYIAGQLSSYSLIFAILKAPQEKQFLKHHFSLLKRDGFYTAI